MPTAIRSTRCARTTCCGGTGTAAQPVADHAEGADPALLGRFALADGTPVAPAFQLLADRVKPYTPEWADGDHRHTGRDDPAPRARDGRHRARPEDRAADRVDRLLGQGARDGHRQPGRVPRDARARRALQRLPDDPRARDPDVAARHDRPAGRLPPQGAVPARRAAQRPPAEGAAGGASRTRRSTARRSAGPSARTTSSSTSDGEPVRIDKGFSWEYPLSVHGLMHNVITNAWRGDPYRSTRCCCSWPTWRGTRA